MVVKNCYMYLSYSGQYCCFRCLHYCYYYYRHFVVVAAAVAAGVGAAVAGVWAQQCWLNVHEKTGY